MRKPGRVVFDLCVTCMHTRDDPHFRFPTHLVHPEHGKHMTWDVRGEAICPDCGTRWARAWGIC